MAKPRLVFIISVATGMQAGRTATLPAVPLKMLVIEEAIHDGTTTPSLVGG